MKPDETKGKTNWENLRAKRKSAPAPSEDDRKEAREFWADADVVIPEGKTRMTVRFDTDVVEWFKSYGPKYQTRMNAVLRQFMRNQSKSTSDLHEVPSVAAQLGSENMTEYMEALNQLGRIRLQQDDPEAASRYFEEAVNCYRSHAGLDDNEETKMKESYQKTLERLTKLYLNSEQFNGVRADKLALEAEMDPQLARIVLRDLCIDGMIDIVSQRAFLNPYIKADRAIPKDIQLEDIETDLTNFCVYPSPKHLEKAVKKKRYPYYKTELAKGGGHLDIRYFHERVLDHYRMQPESYIVNENPFGMGQRLGAFAGLPKRLRYKAWGAVKCTGIRQLSNGGRAICVLLRYLAQMAPDEQEYWSTFEMAPEQQDFIPDSADEVFTKWYYGPVRTKPAWQAEDEDNDR